MKRPAGFDPAARPAARPTAQPAAPPTVGERPASGPAVPRASRKAGEPRDERKTAGDATEPITLPAHSASTASSQVPSAPAPSRGVPSRGVPTSGVPSSAAPSTDSKTNTPANAQGSSPAGTGATPRARGALAGFSLPRPRAKRTAGGPGPAAEADAPLTPRAARARLRAARRARKQYERSEVRRFTSRSRRRRNLWIVAAVTLVSLVAFVLVGVFSPLMALRNIEITGTSRIPAADVAQALDGQLGTPLPLLDLAEVRKQLSGFSLIRSYVTESRPPDTLVVRIVEREPIAAVVSAAGFDLVDAAGVDIQSSPQRPEGYPLVDAAGGTSGAGFQAAVAVVSALPDAIRAQLDSVSAATKDDVTLTLAGGARVVWGNSERSDFKAIVLAALIVSHPVGSVTEYDVSSPDSAVVR